MKNYNLYIHGLIFGIKTSIKFMARIQDIKKAISALCEVQKMLIDNDFDHDNTKAWYAIEKKMIDFKY